MRPSWDRRRVLTGGLLTAAGVTGLAALTGCTGHRKPKAGRPDPVRPLLAGTLALLALYDATAASHPELAGRLTPLRADHEAHARALKAALAPGAPTASPSPPPTPGPSVPASSAAALAALVAAEQQAQRTIATACLAAPASTATLLGAIAACRATHQAVLR